MESTLVDFSSLVVVFLGLLQAGQASVVKKKDEEEPWTDPFTYPNGTRKVIMLSDAIQRYQTLLYTIQRYRMLISVT